METAQVISTELGRLAVGESVTIPLRKGWELVLTSCGSEEYDATLQNPHTDQRFKFFIVTTVGNPYGAPIVDQEPSLHIPFRNCGVESDGAIVGAIVRDASGAVTGRFSWSNLVFVQKKTVQITSEGELLIDGKSHGFLRGAFLADKNRMRGHVGVFGPTKPESSPRIVEMEDLVFAVLDS